MRRFPQLANRSDQSAATAAEASMALAGSDMMRFTAVCTTGDTFANTVSTVLKGSWGSMGRGRGEGGCSYCNMHALSLPLGPSGTTLLVFEPWRDPGTARENQTSHF